MVSAGCRVVRGHKFITADVVLESVYGCMSSLNAECKAGSVFIGAPLSVRRQYGSVQMCITTAGCLKARAGSCTMCSYGRGVLPGKDELRAALRDVLGTLGGDVRSVLFGTCGSILDRAEFPDELLDVVLDEASLLDPGIRIILETSYTTVNRDILSRIRSRLPDRMIDIEMGLESADPEVLEWSLNKDIDLVAFTECVSMIHSAGFDVTVNILVGSPFLTPEEQVKDASDSLEWASACGADTVVLFPVNIKDGTALKVLYDRGAYVPIPLIRAFEALAPLGPDVLSRVALSWTEEDPEYGFEGTVYPTTCDVCGDIRDTMADMMSRSDGGARAAIISGYLESHRCGCRCRQAPIAHAPGAVESRARSWLSPVNHPFVPMAVRTDISVLDSAVSEARAAGLHGFGIVANSMSDRDAVAIDVFRRLFGPDGRVICVYRDPDTISDPRSLHRVDTPILILGADEAPGFLTLCMESVVAGGFILYTSSDDVPPDGATTARLTKLGPDEVRGTVCRYLRIPAPTGVSVSRVISDTGLLWVFAADNAGRGEITGDVNGRIENWISVFNGYDEYGLTNFARRTNGALMAIAGAYGRDCLDILDFLSLNDGSEPVTKGFVDLYTGKDSATCLDILVRMSAVERYVSAEDGYMLMPLHAGARRRLLHLDGRWAKTLERTYRAAMAVRWLSPDEQERILHRNSRFLFTCMGYLLEDAASGGQASSRITDAMAPLNLSPEEVLEATRGERRIPERIRPLRHGSDVWAEVVNGAVKIAGADSGPVDRDMARHMSDFQTMVLVEGAGGGFDPVLRFCQLLYDGHVIDSSTSYSLPVLTDVLEYRSDKDDGRWVIRFKTDVARQAIGVAARDGDPRVETITRALRGLARTLSETAQKGYVRMDPDDPDGLLDAIALFNAEILMTDMGIGGEFADAISWMFGSELDAEHLCIESEGMSSTRSQIWRVPMTKELLPAFMLNNAYRRYASHIADSDPGKALHLFELSSKAYGVWGNDLGMANLKLEWGRVLRDAGKVDDAYAKASEAMGMAEQAAIWKVYIEAGLMMAAMDTERGYFKKAWANVNRVEHRATMDGPPSAEFLVRLARVKADTFFAQGDLREAQSQYEVVAGSGGSAPERMLAESMMYRIEMLTNQKGASPSKDLMTYLRSRDPHDGVTEGIKRNVLDVGAGGIGNDGEDGNR